MKFEKWLKIRENSIVQNNMATKGQVVPTSLKDNNSKIDTRIKQTMAQNIKKPKKILDSALENLGKQIALDKNATPKDLQKIKDAMGEDNAV